MVALLCTSKGRGSIFRPISLYCAAFRAVVGPVFGCGPRDGLQGQGNSQKMSFKETAGKFGGVKRKVISL